MMDGKWSDLLVLMDILIFISRGNSQTVKIFDCNWGRGANIEEGGKIKQGMISVNDLEELDQQEQLEQKKWKTKIAEFGSGLMILGVLAIMLLMYPLQVKRK